MDSNPAFESLLELARAARQGRNFYEAEKYYTKLLEIDHSFTEAWIGKGQACGMQSTASNLRISEAMVAFGRAISSSPPGERDKTEGLCIRLATKIAVESFSVCYDYILNYYNTNYVRGRDAWVHFFEKTTLLIDSLEEMSGWSPDWAISYEVIESISRKVLEGIPYISEGGSVVTFPKDRIGFLWMRNIVWPCPLFRGFHLAISPSQSSHKKKPHFALSLQRQRVTRRIHQLFI